MLINGTKRLKSNLKNIMVNELLRLRRLINDFKILLTGDRRYEERKIDSIEGFLSEWINNILYQELNMTKLFTS